VCSSGRGRRRKVGAWDADTAGEAGAKRGAAEAAGMAGAEEDEAGAKVGEATEGWDRLWLT
jgi:hypothetical protein